MDIFKKLIGPKSKYEKTIPYTYEARSLQNSNELYSRSYLSDTICGLISSLEKRGITPNDVRILEIYSKKERELDITMCTSNTNQWLPRKKLCEAFKDYYKGHIYQGGCTFSDRNDTCTGP